MKSPYEVRISDEDEEVRVAPVMMMKVVIARVAVVVTAAVVTMEMVMMIATVTVKATIVKTMIANKVTMIGVNPLVIEKMKTKGFIMKIMMMM